MNNELIREELERLRIRKEKDLQNGLADRLRRESAEENWDLAESVFTPEELADVSVRERRLGVWLTIDFATFWLSILFLNVHPSDTFEPFRPNTDILDLGLIGLIVVSFFGWWVLLFLRRTNRQDFTREFALRLEARMKAGRKTRAAGKETP